MKLTFVLVFSSLFAVSAFGVSPAPALTKKALYNPAGITRDTPIHSLTASGKLQEQQQQQQLATSSSAVTRTRGGAVPGWAAYNKALDTNPLTAKALTSLVGWALGDVLAQIFISGGPFDMKRFLSLSFFGFIYHGPSGHFFYNWLDNQVKGTRAQDVALKVGIDQIFWCPIFMTVFFTYLGLVNGDSFATIGNKIKSDLLSACQGSWKVWPIVHAVNFKFISNKHRLVFINTVQVAFNMFLSLIGSKK